MQVCSRSLPDDPSTAILAVGVFLIWSMRKVITLLGGITEKIKAAIKVRCRGRGSTSSCATGDFRDEVSL